MDALRVVLQVALAFGFYLALLRRPKFARASRGRQYLIFFPLAAALFVVIELVWPLASG
jgi:hypothetical protein